MAMIYYIIYLFIYNIIKVFNFKCLMCINCKFMSLKFEAVHLDFTLDTRYKLKQFLSMLLEFC